MECPFVVGQKVVCVDASSQNTRSFQPVVENSIYTVRSIFVSPIDGQVGVLLNEIRNDFHPVWGLERGYFARRFGPLVTRKSDISIFTAILNGHRVPEAA